MPALLAFLPGLLSNKLFQYGALALAIFLALAGLYWKGHSDGYAVSEAAYEAAAVAEAKRESTVATQVAADSQKQTTQDKAADTSNVAIVAKAVKKIRAEMPPMPTETVTVTGQKITMEMPNVTAFADAVCVPADVVDELRNIR